MPVYKQKWHWSGREALARARAASHDCLWCHQSATPAAWWLGSASTWPWFAKSASLPCCSFFLEVRNVTVEVRNVTLEVRNVTVEVRNVTVEVRNIMIEVRNVMVEVRNVTVEVR